jgi:hypothetical protein
MHKYWLYSLKYKMDMNFSSHSLTLVLFIGFSLYNMGNMMSLQMQHYSLYPLINPANFLNYIKGNNKAALFPAILPGLTNIVLSIILVIKKPETVSSMFVYIGLTMNLIAIASTVIWQARIQGQMAHTGFDATKIQTLISTNWIRTIAYSINGIMSLWFLTSII